MDKIIEHVNVSNLFVRFANESGEVQALDNITFSMKKGEFLTVLGPSGCGKSTLIRTIAGFQKPLSGGIRIAGVPAGKPSPQRIMVFQEFDQLLPWKTVYANVEYALALQGINREERDKRARHYIELVGLNGFEKAFPYQLSGGMKQRVAIARSMALNPEILLMDEPFGSLDAQTRAILQAELVRLWQNIGATIIFITHNIQEAILLGDRVMVMATKPGRVMEIVPVGLDRPRLPETPEFMALWHHLYSLMDVKRFGEETTSMAGHD